MNELPHGFTWDQAPDWVTVLLDGGADRPSKYSWAESHESGAARKYVEGHMLASKVEDGRLYTIVVVRPTHGLDE